MFVCIFLNILMLSTTPVDTSEQLNTESEVSPQVAKCRRYFFDNFPVTYYDNINLTLLKKSARIVLKILKMNEDISFKLSMVLAMESRNESFLRKQFEFYLKQEYLGRLNIQHISPEFNFIASLALHSSWIIYKLSQIKNQIVLEKILGIIKTRILNAIDVRMSRDCPWKIHQLYRERDYVSLIKYLDIIKDLKFQKTISRYQEIMTNEHKHHVDNSEVADLKHIFLRFG